MTTTRATNEATDICMRRVNTRIANNKTMISSERLNLVASLSEFEDDMIMRVFRRLFGSSYMRNYLALDIA